jgi:peroxiredoxin Q/BCP
MATKKAGKPKTVAKTATLLRTKLGVAAGSKRVAASTKKRAPAAAAGAGEPTGGARRGGKTKASDQGLEASTPQGTGVAVGDAAPSFVLKDDTGQLVSSESLRGAPYVLYFYPKDDTPGCTIEACGFRDSMPRFDAKGVRIIGVSPDSPEAHARFKKKFGLSFSLLSDPEKTLAKAYGVWVKKRNYGREYMGVERSTFHVDRRGTVRQVWRAVRVPGHVDAVLHSV